MARFEEAFERLPTEAQRQVQEIAAFAVLQSHLKDPATPVDLDTVKMVGNALAINYDGNKNRIEADYQSVMSSRFAQEEKTISI